MKQANMHYFLQRFFGAGLVVLMSLHAGWASEPPFYSQCHKLLPIADDFARECQEKAHPFSRTFHPSGGDRGEVESYSAYFKALDAPSNFVLGCVLNFKRKLSFVGLYYLAQPLDMAGFENYPITFIDPDGNVGFQIDGVRQTFPAVRQFITDVIPPRLTGRPANCDDPHIESFEGSEATALFHFRKISDDEMEYCNGDYCRTAKYLTVGGSHKAPVIYAFHDLLMVDADGVLLLKEDYSRKICAWKSDASSIYNLIYEACSKVK